MPAIISLHPGDQRGRERLDELEAQTGIQPEEVAPEDGTRTYSVLAQDATIDAFDPILDKIDPQWRNHVTNVTPR